MSLDSTANLLFTIGADADDATGNIQRFRTLLGKDLAGMGAEFSAWSKSILGEITTVQGAMIASGAILGAAVVAVGAFAIEAAHKYSAYVDEVERGSRVTGISVENMSKLKFAAEATHTSYDSLVTGLTKFTSLIVKATGDWEHHGAAFQKLGITQQQVAAGERDMMPLLDLVIDRYKQLGSRVLQTAEAKELFSKGGAALVQMLSQGSAGMKELFAEAEKLGLVIGTKDVQANEEYKASIHLMKAEVQAFAVTIGRDVLPLLTVMAAQVYGFAQAMKQSFEKKADWADYLTLGIKPWIETFQRAGVNADAFKVRMEELAKSLSKFGDEGGATPLAKVAKEAKGEWQGLSDLLEQVKERTEDLTSMDEKQQKEFEHLQFALAKTTAKYQELKAAGKLSPEDAVAQAAALAGMNAALSGLLTHYIAQLNTKNAEAGADLENRIGAQQDKTYAQKVAGWDREIEKLQEHLKKEGSLTEENQTLLTTLWTEGHAKLEREQTAAVEKTAEDLDQRLGAHREKGYGEQVAAWDREINKLAEELQKKGTMTAANQAMLTALWQAGHDKIENAAAAAYAAEMSKLGAHLEAMLARHTTHAQQLKAAYDKDLLQFSQVEEKKALLTATSEAQRTAIEQRFADIRAALLGKYQQDLQALTNSQGWQGVFSSKFATMIHGNEALTKEWASSTNQSLMMVRVTMEGLKETGTQAFEQLSQGMGQNIASAIVYKKSIGDAMRSAVASTLESLAAESITWAIYSTALGFTRLAQHDAPGATAAFNAAAIWGSVGAAAAVAGRAIAPAQAGATASSAAAGSTSAGAAIAGTGAATAASGPKVTVNIWGHVIGMSGIEEVTAAINDAVINKDVTLTATNTKGGQQVTR